MIDVSPDHIGDLLDSRFLQDVIEHYCEEEEFESLDFSCESDARYAIRRWIGNEPKFLPEESKYSFNINLNSNMWSSKQHKKLFKESLRYVLTKKLIVSGAQLPGIDFNIKGAPKEFNAWTESHDKNWIWTERHCKNAENAHHRFLMLLWDEWFDEPFTPADLDLYRERVDRNFISFPFNPDCWGDAEYKES